MRGINFKFYGTFLFKFSPLFRSLYLAEHIAEEFQISRQKQDEYSLLSQKKAKEAIENGKFKEEIVPVPLRRSGETVSEDEYPQLHCTIEMLTKLKPVFRSKVCEWVK